MKTSFLLVILTTFAVSIGYTEDKSEQKTKLTNEKIENLICKKSEVPYRNYCSYDSWWEEKVATLEKPKQTY